jgi:WD40 repeat protein
VWDARSGAEVLTLKGHTGWVRSASFSPDGRTLAAAGLDRTVKLWEVATGKEVATFRGHPLFGLMSYSPDGRTLAVVGSDNTVQFWDTAAGKVVPELRSPRGVTDVSYSPDGRTLALVTPDMAHRPNGRIALVAQVPNGAVEIWDAHTTNEVVVLRGHSGTVARVVYSPDGRTLASAGGDRTVKLWDAATGREIRTLRGHAGAVLGVAFSPDGRTLASASEDKTIKLWNAATCEEVRTLRGHGDGVGCVAYSPDGRTLASAGADNTVKLWNAATGEDLRTLSGHPYAVDCVAFSPDGRTLSSAGAHGTVKLWDATTDAEARELRTGSTTRGYYDNTKRQWVTSFPRAAGQAYNGVVAYRPDGRTLATVQFDNTVKLWDLTGLHFLGMVDRKTSPYKTQMWDAPVRTLVGHVGVVLGAAYSADGRRIASASRYGTVKLWDTMTGQEVLTLRGIANEINGVAFSPDGYQIAAACGDGTIQIWDARPLSPEVQTTREARRQLREKRGGGQVRPASDLEGQGDDDLLAHAVGSEPTPEFAAMVAEEYRLLLERLDDDVLRRVAILRMEGYTGDEIAARLGCARRTVARQLALIRRILAAAR